MENENESKMTKMEMFFVLITIILLTLGIGYKNTILGVVGFMTGFFAIGSIIVRKNKE